MLRFPIQNLFIEGPDCAGKSTLIEKIHKISEYRWHIMDRSQISRKIFSALYSRDTKNIDQDLHIELSNLNNAFVFLLPSFKTIEKRFHSRGDDFHNSIDSIRQVYDSFTEKYKSISSLPNVSHYSSESTDEVCEKLICYLDLIERPQLREISECVLSFVKASGNESYPLSFTLYDDGEFEEAKIDILNHETESEYYNEIFCTLMRKIEDELAGKNKYGRVETVRSRRFVYAGESCISFIQVANRDGMMDFHVVIRSSDTKNIFCHDLSFLYFLASECWKKIGSGCTFTRIRVNINSAHVIR